MKKIIGILTILLLAASLSACQKKDEATIKCEYIPQGSSTVLIPGEKFNPSEAGIGETTAYTEAASCYFDGMDKIFTYDGFEITTYPAADGDYIQYIQISDEKVSTAEGIHVGSTLDELIQTYGGDYTLAGKMYRYYLEDEKYLYFFMMNDVVKYYGYAIEIK